MYVVGGLFASLFAMVATVAVWAQQPSTGSDFGLHITPSPLVSLLKPGQKTEIEMKITNTGRSTENLLIQPREFEVDRKTGEVRLLDTVPSEVNDWVTFSSPTFSVKPGEVFTQKIKVDLPAESGFSYSFTLLISRTAGGDKTVDSGASLRGSVAVFTLFNVDRPGATRKFEVADFKPTQPVYEYLPAEFLTTFQNTGNTIVQPLGNVFVSRGTNDKEPITVLPVNPSKGYILPDRPRTIPTTWDKGFPIYSTITGNDGQQKKDLVWDWTKIMDFRMGLYTAKLVAVYNDGQRDIPIERTVQFWVIPWRLILAFLAIISVFVVGAWVILRKSGKLIHVKKKKKHSETEE